MASDDDDNDKVSIDHDSILDKRINYRDKDKFMEYVKAHTNDKGYVSAEDERELLRAAVARFDIEYEEARWAVLGILSDRGVVLERELDRRIEKVLSRFHQTGKKITRAEFKDAVAIYRDWSNDSLSESQAKKKLKGIIKQKEWKVGRAGIFFSRRWFEKIDADS